MNKVWNQEQLQCIASIPLEIKYQFKYLKEPWKSKWLEALRSGTYTQGMGRLKVREYTSEGRYRHCCLGILCELTAEEVGGRWLTGTSAEGRTQGFQTDEAEDDHRLSFDMPPHTVMALTGMSEPVGNNLARMNDSHQFSFEDIADLVEELSRG